MREMMAGKGWGGEGDDETYRRTRVLVWSYWTAIGEDFLPLHTYIYIYTCVYVCMWICQYIIIPTKQSIISEPRRKKGTEGFTPFLFLL